MSALVRFPLSALRFPPFHLPTCYLPLRSRLSAPCSALPAFPPVTFNFSPSTFNSAPSSPLPAPRSVTFHLTPRSRLPAPCSAPFTFHLPTFHQPLPLTTLAITQSIDPVKGGGLGMAVCDLHRAMARACGEDTVVIGIDGDHLPSGDKFRVRSFPGVRPRGCLLQSAPGGRGGRRDRQG